MKARLPKYDDDIPEGHAFQEHRPLNTDDVILRRHGFRIHARPSKGQVVWGREGKYYPQSLALALCSRTDKEKV